MTPVCWLFSMARSGTSAVCYAAAAPFGLAVADEPFGPWDRTIEPFRHPATQKELMGAFAEADRRLTPRVVELAERLFEEMGSGAGRGVICKIPHVHPSPEDFERAFPGHRAIWLMRNPLHRINSLYARGWLPSLGANHDLERFRIFAARWLARPERERFVYDDLRGDAAGFFGRLYAAWGIEHSASDVEAAVAYARTNYHHRSKRVDGAADPSRVVSESGSALPDAAVEAYLSDELVLEVMRAVGWSTDPEDYRAARATASEG